MDEFRALVSQLTEERSCLLGTHISPDPDAIGSCFGLAHFLRHLGIEVFVWLQDPLQEKFSCWTQGVPWSTAVPDRRFTAFVGVDTASRPRIGREVEALIALADRSYNIDHHISNTRWAERNYIDGDAPSCSAIIWRLFALKGLKPSALDATGCLQLLYGGLCDDTGRFCFPNATPEAFAVASAMVEAGARPEQVAERLYFSQPLRMLQLQGVGLRELRTFAGGAGSLIVLNNEDFASVGAVSEDSEGIVEIARSVEGTDVAVFLRQLENGWKVSLRSKVEWLDVNGIAGQFGGGGHRAAAGCRVTGSQDEATKLVVSAVEAAMREHRPRAERASELAAGN